MPRPAARPKKKARPAPNAGPIDIAALRAKLNLSQRGFAAFTRVPLRTVLGWEYGRNAPPPASLMFLLLLDHHPKATVRMIKALPEEALP